ncbi:MAG: potassium channel family protein [Chromatiaceae bacterium]|jgi:hypothetical protein|nr:potassium channel family protein [Chromatiaceae bacterium]
MPLSRLARVYRLAVGDKSMTLILGLLMLYMFILIPQGELGLVLRPWLNLGFLAVLAVAVLGFVRFSSLARLFVLAVLALAVTNILLVLVPGARLQMADALFSLIAAGLLGTLLLQRTLRRGEINVHRYQGAFATFVLLGVMFAQGYELVAMVEPGAFQVLGAPATYDTMLPKFLYYSFTTLTTLGYGDITPIHPYARSLAVLESLAGVIYPAVLIARLVSLDVIDEQDARRERS